MSSGLVETGTIGNAPERNCGLIVFCSNCTSHINFYFNVIIRTVESGTNVHNLCTKQIRVKHSVLCDPLLSSDLKVLPEAAPSGHNADLNAGTSGSTTATSPVCKEEVEMRAALQFLMRHMVKRAVMRSPIKRALGLADLERAQAMIYKLVVNGLLEEPSSGKAKPGENM